jgi:2,3-bisphosphoglycerate-independent phosphoglycerate mutase
MKYVVILGDGMSDEPIDSLGGKTPLEAASTPNIDQLASKSEIGLAHTIPNGMQPGSDVANLSVLGYAADQYYTGRSPLEALSIGVPLRNQDVSLRTNFVTLDDHADFKHKKIIDHSSGEITTQEAKELLETIKNAFETEIFKFYLGTSYRHLLVWETGDKTIPLTPPHDILGQEIGKFLPNGENGLLLNMMEKSYELLKDHPVNKSRIEKGLNPANAIWLWGAGTKPQLDSFEDKFGLKGAMISAVDLLKGIAVGADMKVIHVEGADGTLHTNYEGKAQAALDVLDEECDFVYVHIEAPDECGHQGNLDHKIKAIEYLDERIVGPIVEGLNKKGIDYKILITPDHPTPIRIRTHTSDPVPYLIYHKENEVNHQLGYNEKDAKKSQKVIEVGHELMKHFLK